MAAGKAAPAAQASTKAADNKETQAPKADAPKGDEAAAGKTGDEGKGESTETKTGDEAKTGDDGKGKESQGDEGSGKKKDEGKAGEGEEAKPKAPETYELTVPDDAKRFVSDEDLNYFQEIAKANDWTNEEAQAELTAHIERAAKATAKTIEGWEATTKADKTYGGKQLAETQRLGNIAVDRVFPKGHPMREPFVGFLKESGGGVRLEVVAFLATLGRMMGEDTTSSGVTSSGGGERASKFYDHPSSNAAREIAAKT